MNILQSLPLSCCAIFLSDYYHSISLLFFVYLSFSYFVPKTFPAYSAIKTNAQLRQHGLRSVSSPDLKKKRFFFICLFRFFNDLLNCGVLFFINKYFCPSKNTANGLCPINQSKIQFHKEGRDKVWIIRSFIRGHVLLNWICCSVLYSGATPEYRI